MMSDAADLTPQDRDHLVREYDRLAGEMQLYFTTIVSTERLVLAGAAATAAFLYTDLPEFAAGQAKILSALPFAIVVLGGLRCLTIFVVMLTAARYLQRIEARLMTLKGFGIQRSFTIQRSPTMWMIVVTTTLFWATATLASGYFWLAFTPAGAAN